MRIMKIDSQSKTNFKGLEIDKRAFIELVTRPASLRQSIDKAGKELETVKDYVLSIDKELGLSIHKVGEKDWNYWQVLKCQMNRAGRYYNIVESDGGGETVRGGRYPQIPPILTNLWGKSTNKKEQYEEFKKMDNLSRATYLIKMLSQRDAEKKAAKLVEINQQENLKHAAFEESENLIAKYGVDMEAAEKPVKQTLWKRFTSIFKK